MIPVLDLNPEIEEIRAEIDAAIANVINESAFIMGPEVKTFESAVAEYLGVKHAIGVNSGTDALVLALRGLGIGSGDEVITSPFSFFATAESISMVGAKPVFVDINPVSFNIDPEKIEAAITPATKAIMPVHLYGNPCAMAQILTIAKKHKLFVVEDCAQSFGARYTMDCEECNGNCDENLRKSLSGKQTGTIGDAGAYSFFPSKNLGCFGDGGLVATNDDALAGQVRMLRVHGAKKKYHNEVLGYNSRLDTIQAAVLGVKLPHIDRWNAGRRQAAARYEKLFAGTDKIVTPKVHNGHVFHQYTIILADADRDAVQVAMKEKGIGTMVYYPVPQDKLPVYAKEYTPQPVSEQLSDKVLSLPIWPSVSEDIQQKVADALLEIVA